MSVAFLCPGQGAQQVGMLHHLPDHPAVGATLQEASAILGYDVTDLDSEEQLLSTVAVQLATVIASVATARALSAEGFQPAMVGGLSVGAFSAAVIAGHLAFPDAVRLVRLRGELMQHAYPHGYGMGVITGLTETQVHRILASIHTETIPVYLANVNAPRQIAIAGANVAINQALEQARNAGAHLAEPLSITVPSHCPLMESVAQRLEHEIQRIALVPSPIRYISSGSARLLTLPKVIGSDLARNVAQPVHWYDTTTALYEYGARLFIELPPGSVLTAFANDAFPLARAIAVEQYQIMSLRVLLQQKQ